MSVKDPYHGGKDWHTCDEITFLNNIGSFGVSPTNDKKPLLQGYLRAAERRKRWGKINKDAVIKHAKKLLKSA